MPISDALQAALVDALGPAGVSASTDDLIRHGTVESFHPPAPPDLVVYPGSTDEVSRVVSLCAEHDTPMVPFGAGTSLEGNISALHGGVCIDLSRMKRIVRVSAEDLDVTVEAGVTRLQLELRLREDGLFFPVDPGADATFGGMASTGASGTMAVRYGTMRENVLSLTVVMPDGRVTRTRSRARKSSAGYDLTHLFIGAEGTLGIITEITLRVQPLPAAIAGVVCSFPTVNAAVDAVVETLQFGIPVARMELLDALQMDAINRRSGLTHPVQPTLLIELHGSEAGVAEQSEGLRDIMLGHGAEGFAWSADPVERRRLWDARHQAYEAGLGLRPGGKGLATDVCVPISRLAECISATQADVIASGLIAPIVGHVGDGNFHVLFVLDPDDPDEMARATSTHERMVRRAIEMGGTCTGEHGVGYGKMKYLPIEHDAPALDMMRSIKGVLDPKGLMNPGKVVPFPVVGRLA